MPMIMIRANLEEKIHWNNIFTPKDYISQAIGLAGMILRQEKPVYPNLKLDVGKYCQVYEKTRKEMMPRSVGFI